MNYQHSKQPRNRKPNTKQQKVYHEVKVQGYHTHQKKKKKTFLQQKWVMENE